MKPVTAFDFQDSSFCGNEKPVIVRDTLKNVKSVNIVLKLFMCWAESNKRLQKPKQFSNNVGS